MSDEELLLLDTHVWIWLVEARADRVSPAAKRELDNASASGHLFISVMSIWEIAMLVSKGRLANPLDVPEWTARALAAPGLQLVDLESSIAIDSTRLPGSPPKDPVDRILIATARRMGARLVTADRKILDYARRSRAFRVVKAHL